jgi:uncharacterized protein YggU (UPF0235/DUF167 family)
VSTTLAVRVQARARQEGIVGMRHGVLIVRVSAPPVDGRENRALCALIAKTVGLAPSAVSVTRGAGVREKIVRVDGLEHDELMRALGYSP